MDKVTEWIGQNRHQPGIFHSLQGFQFLNASYPKFESRYLVESTKEYPVSINGKLRTTMVLDLAATQDQVQEAVLQNEVVQKWIEGKPLKKLIFVKGKMINVVV